MTKEVIQEVLNRVDTTGEFYKMYLNAKDLKTVLYALEYFSNWTVDVNNLADGSLTKNALSMLEEICESVGIIQEEIKVKI